jgi:hypothetical protein
MPFPDPEDAVCLEQKTALFCNPLGMSEVRKYSKLAYFRAEGYLMNSERNTRGLVSNNFTTWK